MIARITASPTSRGGATSQVNLSSIAPPNYLNVSTGRKGDVRRYHAREWKLANSVGQLRELP